MERLGHMIQNAVDNGLWLPFRFIRNGTPLSHLFFADDLILYAKADLSQAEAIANILSDFGPMFCYLRDPDVALSRFTFADVSNVDGNWDISRLAALFDNLTIVYILSVKCPNLDDGADRCMWRWTPKHNFEFKSAYTTLSESLWSPKQTIWPVIWHLQVPQQIRHMSSEPSCPVCHYPHETALHALRDCDAAREIWLQILPAALIRPFFDCNLQQWISCNLSATMVYPLSALPWKLVFVSLAWQIWKRRNDLIFQDSAPISDMAVINRNLVWAKHYSEGATA
ncbi:hypothetical protein V6N11_070018 [Hibiscus sabdariffa]|uniref:Reverse transcriptase zinc-binding domain-containing protein n=1 Tax=Hibiscus sabdariffa TaxID=183260 RepID=A0ABR2QDX0_9ROSI